MCSRKIKIKKYSSILRPKCLIRVQIFLCVRSSNREAFMLDFILGYSVANVSAKAHLKHPSSAGCAGHILFSKHLCAVFYNALRSFQMLHKLHKQFC